MKKFMALILIIVAGYIGYKIGVTNNIESDLGVIFSIAVMGYFILDAIEQKK